MITAIVPVSPIPSHPDTAILTETLDSVRHWLPDAEIILTFDGAAPHLEHRRQAYEEHIANALWLADHHYGNICPIIFDDHHHQIGMLAHALNIVETPLVAYIEQDTPMVIDEHIDFDLISGFVSSGRSNCVRLHHESQILPDHQHMVHGDDGGFIRTSQWSQRPHVASLAFYRRIHADHLDGRHGFIEDVMHGVLADAYKTYGMAGWNQYCVHLYNPGPNMQRSYHLDGRAGDPKCP